MHIFGTKAETLEFLYQHQEEVEARVLPLCYFPITIWKENRDVVWRKVEKSIPLSARIIVRSSARGEDGMETSLAGKYDSIVCARCRDEFERTVDKVLTSYEKGTDEDQFLVQPVLEQPEWAGVAFTMDPNGGGNYYVINYDTTGSTSSVTSGKSKGSHLFYCFKECLPEGDEYISHLCRTLGKLECLFGVNRLDVEFAFKDENVYIFQVRPLLVKGKVMNLSQQSACIRRIKNYIRSANDPRPFLHGERTLYSNMTDWNPAEIIGIHPKNLALSLYRELITDAIWAYQRDNYGYMRLRSFPLMIDFCGMPYIDVRVSFNSFIPADLPFPIAEKLVNYYLHRLADNPAGHDKVEFDIIFSCYTFDLPERIEVLREYNFSSDEIEMILVSLRNLTNRIINSKTGLWRKDAENIKILERRFRKISAGELDEIGKMYWLIEDCKRYGTLPFAGLARAGFIAVQILQSMVKKNIIDKIEYEAFMGDVATISSQMKFDFNRMSRCDFLRKYGHLRPGTYDITSPRYDEKPELYFNWGEKNSSKIDSENRRHFKLTLPQLSSIYTALDRHGLDDDVLGLFMFIKSAIEGREEAKFIFTKNLSETLRLFALWGGKNGFSKDDMAYADVQIIKEAYSTANDRKNLIYNSIAQGKKKYEENRSLVMPPLITRDDEVEHFFVPDSQPTFITQKKIHGKVFSLSLTQKGNMGGMIVLIPSADPGFDWIFSQGIIGFVTEYGGANSHMAIRAGELQIPAIIGAGEKLFSKLTMAQEIEIDSAAKRVTVLR